jgi:cytochrome c-type biogenesis protein
MEGPMSLLVALGAGIASFFTPCILLLIPAYLALITGISIAQLQDLEVRVKNLKKILYESILFILGFSFIFVALGASASLLSRLLTAHQETLRMTSGILIMVLGLYLTGIFQIKLLSEKKILRPIAKPATFFGSFLIGGLFAISWTPCAGPILAAILTYAAIQETFSKGILLLGIYSLGLGIPFLLTALAINIAIAFIRKIKRYFKLISIVNGLLLIILGALIILKGGLVWK